jgi:hypothetical protein
VERFETIGFFAKAVTTTARAMVANAGAHGALATAALDDEKATTRMGRKPEDVVVMAEEPTRKGGTDMGYTQAIAEA